MRTLTLEERIRRGRVEQQAAEAAGHLVEATLWARRIDTWLDEWASEHATKEPA